jgi:phosphoglycolate phosphatase-like HAD superfamily hydrolase
MTASTFNSVVLLDFDGTVLQHNVFEPQAIALCIGIEQTFHVAVDRNSTDWTGKTDLQLARELLAGRGDFDAGLEAYKANYYKAFLDQYPFPVPVRDGWMDTLPELSRGFRTALVTGNILSICLAKISGAGLKDAWLGLDRSAFGNDAEKRADLVRIALERSKTTDAVLVGDTWRDIEAAHANNIPAIGLVTEKHSAEELGEAEWIANSPQEVLALVRDQIGSHTDPTTRISQRN